MELQQIGALSLLLLVYGATVTNRIHRAAVALAAAVAAAAFWGLPAAAGSLIPEVLLVTAGLMVLAGAMKRAGIASWLALKAAKAGSGRPSRILLLTGLLTALIGAYVGPLAAVALVVPVALLLAVELDVSPLPFVVVLPWTSLLGGAATLTSQPGNLWVGTLLGIDGGAWVEAMIPYAAAALAATLAMGHFVFGKLLRVTNERRARVLEYDERQALGGRPLLVKTLVVLALVAVGLIGGPLWHLSPALVTVGGAVLLWLWDSPRSEDRFLGDIGGPTLLFFGGIMIVTATLTASGLMQVWLEVVPSSPLLVLWSSALLGAFIDHGAVAGTLAPLAQGSWPFLILGTTLGAGVTVLGSTSAAALGLTGQGSRKPTWQDYTKFGLLFGLVNLGVVSGLSWILG